jgi:hypothetical protein
LQQLPSWHDDDIESRRDLVTAKNVSYQSFSTISLDGAAQLFRRRDPQPPDSEAVGQHEDRAVAAVNPDALIVDLFELGAAANPFIETQARGRLVQRGDHRFPYGAGRLPDCYSLLTVRRFRPLARRRFSTRRPFFELIRTRNPCAFRRRRVFG